VKNAKLIGILVIVAGGIDFAIALALVDKPARTVVMASGAVTVALGLFFVIRGLRQGPE